MYWHLIWIDYAIIALIVISAMIGLFRGFVREAISVLTWVLAVWVGLAFSKELSAHLVGLVSLPSLRIALAFAILMLTTLGLGALLGFLLAQLVTGTGLTGSDRFAGLLFGVARGVVFVVVLVLLAGLTPMPQDPWWRESVLLGDFQAFALWLRDQLPAGMAGYVAYR